MRTIAFDRSSDDRVVAGVCAGIARSLAVDVTLVRLVFALLALAGGAGIFLYLALWAFSAEQQPWWAWALLFVAGTTLLQAVGVPGRAVVGIALVAAGLTIAWRQGGHVLRPDAPLSIAGIGLVAAGAVILLSATGPSSRVLAPGAVAGALLLVCGPWLWQLAVERDAERSARIRGEERAEVAARVHDSVLQTLALIQRHAGEPRRVASLARRQERELRGWLYGDRPLGDDSSLVAALSAAAADVEELHGVRIEIASSGDAAAAEPLVLAAREAMTNAAKFAGVEEIDVYVEVAAGEIAVFVRDRGSGFERAAVPPGRRGLVESIEGRLARAGGTARVTSSPGAGTEVELRLPREDA
jgi:signal transduction histidine kinase